MDAKKINKILDVVTKICSITSAIVQIIKSQVVVQQEPITSKQTLTQEDAEFLRDFLKEDIK